MTITYIRYWGSYFKHKSHDQFITLMRSVANAGWKPYLVCSQPATNHQIADEVLATGAEIVYMPRTRGNFDIGCIQRVYRLCKHLDCTIFHCDNRPTSPLIGAALAGVPVRLWSKRSMNSAFEAMRKMTLRDRLAISVRMSCWFATRVLTVSPAVKNELVDLGIPSYKLMVYPNPVNVRTVHVRIRGEVRRELGYKDDEFVFTSIGHAVPVKGWDTLLQSFAKVVAEYPRSRLLFVGSVTDTHEQKHYSVLQNCIRESGIADYVRFLGQQSNVTKILAASDVFVLPSRSEGNCNALLEALMIGLPCIATKVGYATECIQDGLNGLLVERGNDVELADAMILLAKSPERRRQIVAHVRAKKKYAPTVSEHSDQFVEICKKLLQANGNITPR